MKCWKKQRLLFSCSHCYGYQGEIFLTRILSEDSPFTEYMISLRKLLTFRSLLNLTVGYIMPLHLCWYPQVESHITVHVIVIVTIYMPSRSQPEARPPSLPLIFPFHRHHQEQPDEPEGTVQPSVDGVLLVGLLILCYGAHSLTASSYGWPWWRRHGRSRRREQWLPCAVLCAPISWWWWRGLESRARAPHTRTTRRAAGPPRASYSFASRLVACEAWH